MRNMDTNSLKIIKTEYNGSLFSSYYDEKNKVYYCPICGVDEDKPIFFAIDDLMSHLKTHVKRRMGAPRIASQLRSKQDSNE